MISYKIVLGISYVDHIIKVAVLGIIKQESDPSENLITTVQKRKLKAYGEVIIGNNLSTAILEGTNLGKKQNIKQRKNSLVPLLKGPVDYTRSDTVKKNKVKDLLSYYDRQNHYDYTRLENDDDHHEQIIKK